jgi:hypothetical protein
MERVDPINLFDSPIITHHRGVASLLLVRAFLGGSWSRLYANRKNRAAGSSSRLTIDRQKVNTPTDKRIFESTVNPRGL